MGRAWHFLYVIPPRHICPGRGGLLVRRGQTPVPCGPEWRAEAGSRVRRQRRLGLVQDTVGLFRPMCIRVLDS
jgi:hypothetical protein